MRYKRNTTKNTIDGRLVFKPKVYPTIANDPLDMFVATETGDRLDTLAKSYYGDSSLWWIIAAANNIHNAQIGFKDGTILRIPANYVRILQNI